MIKAVFLDIDDTILDFEGFVRDVMKRGFARFGLPPYEERMYPVFERVNGRLWRQIEQGQLKREQLIDLRWTSVFAELGIDGDGRAFEEYFKRELRESHIPVPGAEELIPWLAERAVLCAASNGPFDQQEKRLRLAGWRPYFRHLFISEEIGAQKPSPLFFERSLSRLNASPDPRFAFPVEPGEVLMIGDSLSSDMRGGADFGLVTCYLDRRLQPPPSGLRVDYTVRSLTEVKDIWPSAQEKAADSAPLDKARDLL